MSDKLEQLIKSLQEFRDEYKSEDLEKGEKGETKHDRCARKVAVQGNVDNPHAVCVAAGVEPEKWKKSTEEKLTLHKNGQWSLEKAQASSLKIPTAAEHTAHMDHAIKASKDNSPAHLRDHIALSYNSGGDHYPEKLNTTLEYGRGKREHDAEVKNHIHKHVVAPLRAKGYNVMHEHDYDEDHGRLHITHASVKGN